MEDLTMKKKYQQPTLTTIKMQQTLLHSVSGENFNSIISPSDEEAK